MTVNSVTMNTLNTDRMLSLRAQLDDLQRQLGTGMRADNYADLGSQRSTSLEFRAQSATLVGYQTAIQRTEVDISVLSKTLERLDQLASDMKGDALPSSFIIQDGNRTTAQISAEFRFQEIVTLMNTDVEGQFLFSGLSTDTEPVVSANTIMDGSGARAGFKQVASERLQADLGGQLTDPALTGRLTLATVGADTSITEAGNDLYGFQIDTVAGASSSSAAITVTGPAGVPTALNFQVTGPVDAGETVRFAVTYPDGTRSDVVLTATDDPTSTEENTFLVDPVDPMVTAANLGTTIANAIDGLARRDLAAASAIQAGRDFFDNNPPLRVVPDIVNGIAGATAQVADPTNTVIWYQGEDGPLDARLTNTTRVDDGVQIAYGARANEDGLRTTLRETAVFAIQTYSVNDASAPERYTELSLRVRQSIDDPSGGNLPRSIGIEIGTASALMDATKDRHTATKAVFDDILAGTDSVSREEVAAKLLDIQTRLEATYSVTALMRDLSLVNYLR